MRSLKRYKSLACAPAQLRSLRSLALFGADASQSYGASTNSFVLTGTDRTKERENTMQPSAGQLIGAAPASIRRFTASTSDHDSDKQLKERRVPESSFERAFAFGSLAAGLVVGAAGDAMKQSVGVKSSTGSRLSEKNAQWLAEELCRLRGAGLKIGQMLSIQDESLLPPELANALSKVRTHADVMPAAQLDRVLVEEWGENWETKLRSFEKKPFAAASIGQVHRAVLQCGQQVAVKVQFPGVARSIDSDLANLQRVISYTNFLPPGLFIDRIIEFAKSELTVECDYIREAESQRRFHSLLLDEEEIYVPPVVDELSTARILTTHFAPGVPVDETSGLSQEERNTIARTLLKLTLRELFEFRFMQTDPNWANFLYSSSPRQLSMLDFGAAREYPRKFIDLYMKLVWAAAEEDKEGLIDASIKLGLLTGDESAAMMRAHVDAGLTIGAPFLSSEPYDFGDTDLTARVKKDGNTFAKERLTPPPFEVYSLHRRLAGAYSTCIKLKAKIQCRDLLENVYKSYKFEDVK